MIIEILKNWLKSVLPNSIRKKLSYFEPAHQKFANVSFSHEGEDIIIERVLDNYEVSGLYVDVGAHHPQRFSNTYKFYLKGWKGINMDPLPGMLKNFKKDRPRDLNLEIGVSSQEKTLKYYMFNEPALNTFSESLMIRRSKLKHHTIVDVKEVRTYRLSRVLDSHLPENQKIDFLTIDAEGFDLDVLESNNWEKYRPKLVLVESDCKDILSLQTDDIYKFMIGKKYGLVAKAVRTLFFLDLSNSPH